MMHAAADPDDLRYQNHISNLARTPAAHGYAEEPLSDMMMLNH